MNHRFRMPLLALIPSLIAVSCVRIHGPEDVRRDLGRSAGVKLHREFGLTLTRSGMWIARKGLKMADEEQISLRGVRRMEVGIYEVRGRRGDANGLRDADLAALEDWTPIVRTRDPDELVLVLTREQDGRVCGLLVVVADDDEWVLVRMRGKLDRMFEDAVRMAFDEADRPELYARSRVERGLDPEPTPVADGALVGEVRPAAN